MQTIFSEPEGPPPSNPPLPPEVGGINVNFCKSPTCPNFGVPAKLAKWARRKETALGVQPGSAYTIGAVGKLRPSLKCLLCGEHFSIKSNLAVAEEVYRLTQHLLPIESASCPDTECTNHHVPVETDGAYYRFGTTPAGSPRWRCRLCLKTFTAGGRALKRQRITHLNKTILLSLTNKMPLRRIAKVTGLNAVTLYGKIDFLYRQCLAFASAREQALFELDLSRLYVSVDRQEYKVNWSRDTDRRNVVLRAIGSADNHTGYVFGMHLNFDPFLNPSEVESDALAARDAELPYPHRKYARVWLSHDYEEGLDAVKRERDRKSAKAKKGPVSQALGAKIEDQYDAAASREDSEVSELKDEGQKLPEAKGMQTHEEYVMYAHFLFLKGLLRRVEKIRFFLDQDSGIRAACLAAFAPDIRARRVDVFYVRTAKEMTIDKKRSAISSARAIFKAYQDANPALSPQGVELAMMKDEISRAVAVGKWSDRWCVHPIPNMSEPEKAMCWLTDLGDYDLDHQAMLFLKASLHGIDNFFQRVRRSLNPLERPIKTASRDGRTWYGYSPYNPAFVEKLLGIYRVIHNFTEVGKDGKTPAMRLGLAQAPLEPEEIIYFTR
ncbi:hypothetical protein [Noviherbaspirillum sp. UKPF54]|uniref:hypothetical protein n=1 Tax=Noviherbaspirillum sp. UKPF54 TaxID=2601898 RepID=UPI001AEF9E7B|nr:hypothetical protein [Noviherbaspirillum sp. UKPF54]